jgi:hypothetical protein
MWKLGLRPRNSQKKEYINEIAGAVCSRIGRPILEINKSLTDK